MKEIGRTRSGLQMGYTTGSCAAAAAKAAAEMLLSGEEIRQVRLLTPKGIELYLELEEIMRKKSEVSCAVRKYSGDDPDVTNGILVYATVQKVEKKSKINSENSVDLSEKINLDGGIGIGRGTKNRSGSNQQSTAENDLRSSRRGLRKVSIYRKSESDYIRAGRGSGCEEDI
jgi:cobalt-precorrin-5B (C1)-methyltransferase